MKTKNIFLTTLLSLFVASGLWAQDKYEYGILRSNNSYTGIIFITADNQEVTPTKFKDMAQDAIKKVNELSEKGWEVYQTEFVPTGYVCYYLRKKKN